MGNKVKIKTDGVLAEIYINGEKVRGLTRYNFMHSMDTVPTLEMELMYPDLEFDAENIVIKKTKVKIDKINKKRVMISQPMNGKTEEQIRKEREDIVDKLEKAGHEVVDTIFAEATPKDCDTALYYLSKSIEAIGKVDAVLFMNGWRKARGCRIEHEICMQYGKDTMYEYEF